MRYTVVALYVLVVVGAGILLARRVAPWISSVGASDRIQVVTNLEGELK